MKRTPITDEDAKVFADRSIAFIKSDPCFICEVDYDGSSKGQCCLGVKYRGTCKIRREILNRLLTRENGDLNWISVNVKKPTNNETVRVLCDDGVVRTAHFSETHGWFSKGFLVIQTVLFWKALEMEDEK